MLLVAALLLLQYSIGQVLSQTQYSLRLVGGSRSYDGRVEIYYNSQWGTVCDDLWDLSDANVVCRQLFGTSASQALTHAHFGQGSDPIWLDDVECSGSESYLADCTRNSWGSHNCVHSEDAGVVCYSGRNYLRLVGGSTSYEGRVEIYSNNQWGTVCDDGWDLNDAAVVCRQLFGASANQALQTAHFGQGSGQIWLDNVHCSGSESYLIACPSSDLGSHNCGHHEDASVVCNVDCQVTSWGAWGSCNGSCHNTTIRSRNRSGSGTSCQNLEDSERCYLDSKACKINGLCYVHRQRQSSIGDGGCLECNKDVTRHTWTSVSNGSPCSDSKQCTTDECRNGVCSGTLHSGYCLIGSQCYRKDDGNPDSRFSQCQVCDPDQSRFQWTLISGHCLIESQCFEKGDKNPESKYSQCQACDPDQFGFQWTSLDGTSCDDADFCTYSDRCTSSGLCVGTEMPGKCWLATQDNVSSNWDRLSCSNGDLCAYHLDPVSTPTPKCPDNAITIPHDECSLVCQACNATSIVCKTIHGVGCLPDVTACECTVVMWDVCFDNNTAIQNELRHPCQYCHLSRNYRSLIEFANNPEMSDRENCLRNNGCGSVSCIGEVGASAHPVPAPLMVIPSTGTCS